MKTIMRVWKTKDGDTVIVRRSMRARWTVTLLRKVSDDSRNLYGGRAWNYRTRQGAMRKAREIL